VGEVPLAEIKKVKETTEFRRVRMSNQEFRPPIASFPFGHIHGFLPPRPDITDSPTLLAGSMKRFLFEPPQPNLDLLQELTEFVRKFCRKHLVPLSATTDISFDTWVNNINHPETRKQEFRDLWKRINGVLDYPKHYKVKQFMKDESYTDWKHGRAINSRHDAFKCATGPWFSAIEKEVFKLKWFIKYIPVRDRPKALYERLWAPGAVYYASDFTSFESLFTPELMRAVEFQLYDHMTQYLPGRDTFLANVETIMGENRIDSKWFGTVVNGTRMSGEMNTSLGNGFSNLMFWKFLCKKKGSKCDGFVEGDDGIFRVDGPAPTSEDFASLGLVIKVEEHADLNTASFCGNVFDEKIQTQITEPMFALANLFAIPGKYAFSKRTLKLALLRAKAMSMHHQYPSHPILSVAAGRLMQLTRSIDVRSVLRQGFFNEWERSQLQDALKFSSSQQTIDDLIVPTENRLLVEKLYGVTSAQQRNIEDKLKRFHLGDVLHIEYEAPPSWVDYYRNYVHKSTRGLAHCPEPWAVDFPLALPVKPDFVSDGDWVSRFIWKEDESLSGKRTRPRMKTS
jgi:hypothetical protein